MHIFDNDFCPDCEHALTDTNSYTSQIVIYTLLSIPTTIVEYKLDKQMFLWSEVVAEHSDCPHIRRFESNIMAQIVLGWFHEQPFSRKQAELFRLKLDEPTSHRTIYNLTERVAAVCDPHTRRPERV